MWRIIKILKEIEINHESLSLQYLANKFNLTIRTIQKDIKTINDLFSKYGDCKIIFIKNKLNISGKAKVENVIKKILSNFINLTNDYDLIKIYQLILSFIHKKNYTSDDLLIFFKIDKHNLKRIINLINNFFSYYSLNLKLSFKQKIGWLLKGNEIDLRFITTSILINQITDSHYLKKTNLFALFNKLEAILLKKNLHKRYLFIELIWFLVILIIRVKNDNVLNKYYFKFNELPYEKAINHDLIELVNLLKDTFKLKINYYEVEYIKSLLYLTYTNISLKVLENISKTVTNLVFNKYHLPVSVPSFQKKLIDFLKFNFFKIYFNFHSMIIFELMVCPFPLNSTNLYDWEFINIINFVLKKFNIGLKTNLFLNANLFKVFSNLFQETEVNCKIPLYYIKNNFDNLSSVNKQLVLILKNKHPNLLINSLNLTKPNQQLNLINKNYTIIIHKNLDIEWSKYQNIYSIDYNSFKLNNNKLELYISKHINVISFKQFISKIFIFGFFLKENFFNFKNFLLILQEAVVKKYKLNTISFQLENCFFEEKYLNSKILLIKKIVPINNIEIPIILTYIKKPLIFHKKYSINYVFVLIIDSNRLYQNHDIYWFLEKFIKNIKNENYTVNSLYTIINSSLLA